jgi:hypothetical protein
MNKKCAKASCGVHPFRGWPEPCVCTVYDRMYGAVPAKITVCTPYTRKNVWFWPTLHPMHGLTLRSNSYH